jgi:hypothetical protein
MMPTIKALRATIAEFLSRAAGYALEGKQDATERTLNGLGLLAVNAIRNAIDAGIPPPLAHKKEIVKLAEQVKRSGATIVPLKIYFKNGRAKLLIGLGTGRKAADKRQAIAAREMKRDMDRAMHKRR